MNENIKRLWDVRIAFVGLVITLLTLVVGVWQFLENQRSNIILSYELQTKESDLKFQRELYLIRLKTLSETSIAVGNIITQLDLGLDTQKSFASFLSLYWGAMILVESEVLEKRMISFRKEVLSLRSGWATNEDVKMRALNLLDALRKELRKRERI